MPLYVKGTDIEIVGTLERLRAVALAHGIHPDGSPAYVGDTKVWWDEQRTIQRDGQNVWVDEDGNEHLQSEIEQREDQ